MRVRNAPEYKKRIVKLLEVRKERRERKEVELTQVQLFESLDINDEVLKLPSPSIETQVNKSKVRIVKLKTLVETFAFTLADLLNMDELDGGLVKKYHKIVSAYEKKFQDREKLIG